MFSATMLNPKVSIDRTPEGVLMVKLGKDYNCIILIFESEEEFKRNFRIPEKINEEVKIGGTD